jgi:predicted nuclease of restriction endonuclease-like RecB superfamily
MRNLSFILCVLMIAGCKTSSSPPQVSHFDVAIENLSGTAEQLESVRREKDFLVKTLEDFEQQKAQYGYLLDTGQLNSQMQDFAEWHRDISWRERNLEVQHVLNILSAQVQVARHKTTDLKQTAADTATQMKP